MFEQDITRIINNANRAVCRNPECFIVRAVLLGFLRHQADIGDIAHGDGIKCTMLFAEPDRFLIDTGITAIRDHGFGVVQLAIRAPHFAGGTNSGRHGCIDDNITGHMQVGNDLVGVHHRQGRVGFIYSLNVRLDGQTLCFRQFGYLCIDIAQTVTGIHTELLKQGSMIFKQIPEVNRDGMPEHDRIGNLHHGRFQVK